MCLPDSLQDLTDSEAVRFLRRPKSILRILAGVFSLVIFSSLLTNGYQNTPESPQLHCILNSNHMACGFAVGAGFLAFLSCLAFLALDAHESHVTRMRFKMAFRLLDFILAILWAGIWFVAFCFLGSQWDRSQPKHFLLGSSSAEASIIFAFFSVPVWILQAYLAFYDLREESSVPYKHSLDESGVVLSTSSLAASSVNIATTGRNNLSYASSALFPYLSTPKVPCLAMMPDS